MSKSTWGAYSSSGRYGEAFPPSILVALASTSSAAAGVLFGRLFGHRGGPRLPFAFYAWLCRRVRADAFTPPTWRHTDGAGSRFASSKGS